MAAVVFVISVGMKFIIRRNKEVNRVITKICSEFESRLKEQRYVPEYRRKYTDKRQAWKH
eukprot:scaffold7641_cov115-Cylindrotheca_fusiformis.AAC.6